MTAPNWTPAGRARWHPRDAAREPAVMLASSGQSGRSFVAEGRPRGRSKSHERAFARARAASAVHADANAQSPQQPWPSHSTCAIQSPGPYRRDSEPAIASASKPRYTATST
jgi:hypothetical protein